MWYSFPWCHFTYNVMAMNAGGSTSQQVDIGVLHIANDLNMIGFVSLPVCC